MIYGSREKGRMGVNVGFAVAQWATEVHFF